MSSPGRLPLSPLAHDQRRVLGKRQSFAGFSSSSTGREGSAAAGQQRRRQTMSGHPAAKRSAAGPAYPGLQEIKKGQLDGKAPSTTAAASSSSPSSSSSRKPRLSLGSSAIGGLLGRGASSGGSTSSPSSGKSVSVYDDSADEPGADKTASGFAGLADELVGGGGGGGGGDGMEGDRTADHTALLNLVNNMGGMTP
eukprot:g4701.t1